MYQYIIRRILISCTTMLVVTLVAFLLVSLIPVDPSEVALRVNDIRPTEEAVESMRLELGLDRPYHERYLLWLRDALHMDFGTSYVNRNRTVLGEIGRCMPATLKLAAFSLVIVILISIPVGILSAVFKDSLFDRITRVLVYLGASMPSFWQGLFLIWIFAVKLRFFPTGGNSGNYSIILPAFSLSLAYISTYVKLIRNNMLANMTENYVLYARVRGLREKTIILKHVLKNSIQSCITAFGMSVAGLFAGTVVIENIFSWPGIGRLCVSAIFNRDYPIIQAYILMMGMLFVVTNLIVDIIHHLLDPRLRHNLE